MKEFTKLYKPEKKKKKKKGNEKVHFKTLINLISFI